MIVKPKCRGFICITSHPTGCDLNVKEQIDYVKAKGRIAGPKRVLVIGSSTGYGLASRIAAAYGMGASTIGVYFDKPATETKPGTAGWYNNRAFEAQAQADGLVAVSVNGDAFSDSLKAEVIQLIKDNMPEGKVDLIIYSLASPRRTDPVTGQVYNSVIKPVGEAFTSKTIDFHTGVVSEVTVEPASETEVEETIAVMGGADWLRWMNALKDADTLASGVVTTAFSYIGPKMTHAIYQDGTIGRAKADLEEKARAITAELHDLGGKAYVSVNKALVTQASSAIPVVPLYISILYKAMKAAGNHEDCIQQLDRLYRDRLFSGNPVDTDEAGRIRLDDWEMLPDIQAEIAKAWEIISSENVMEISDLEGYRDDFFRLFGFNRSDVDYEAEVSLL